MASEAKKGNSLTIMIVDDNPLVVDLIHGHITSESKTATVVRAKHGGCAWRAISKLGQIPDVMIVDVEMPFMNGLTLTRKVRGQYPNIIIIMISARGEPKNHGAHAFVPKPIVKKDLIGAIRRTKKRK